MKTAPFAHTPAGDAVESFTLTNANGISACLITWGATLTELRAPDRSGNLLDVTLGFDDPKRWFQEHPFFGTIAGRYANRIAHGKFSIDGKTYQLPINNGLHTLHGGISGFDKFVWSAEVFPEENGVQFTHVSADGCEGFPGEVTLKLTYTLTENNELQLDYTAVTDKPTIFNVTNHTYWNLSGEPQILDHVLRLNASRYAAVDNTSIPIGELVPTTGPWDFTTPKPIGRDITQVQDQPGGGFDHSWAIDGWNDVSRIPGADLNSALRLAAELHDPKSGRFMEVLTTEPGIQFYTGNYLDGVPGKSGKVYPRHGGLCLETNHFANSPNIPVFPNTVLRPDEIFRSRTIYRFSVK